MHGNMQMTQRIYDTLPKYDLKPDACIQQRYMEHAKITDKLMKEAEEEKKKKDLKLRKANAVAMRAAQASG